MSCRKVNVSWSDKSGRWMLMLHFTHFHTSFGNDFYTFFVASFPSYGKRLPAIKFPLLCSIFFPLFPSFHPFGSSAPCNQIPIKPPMALPTHDQNPGWKRSIEEGGQNNNLHISPLSPCAFHMLPIFVWLVEREMIAAARILKSFRSSQKCRSKRTCRQWVGSSHTGKRRGFRSLETTKISVVSLNVRRIPSHM